MDKPAKRVRYNPDGTLLIRRWDDKLVVKRKPESAADNTGYRALHFHVQEDTKEDYGYNWETELDYY
ncbi:hypothetical protein [Siminovitchia sp. 179-K 8D1 HS]|uniref:hypothetical protein n=1 Tax=Siminovitchia sp. 179-K 8D1 HS TaxID=3142385 RepID=UPI0039A231C9